MSPDAQANTTPMTGIPIALPVKRTTCEPSHGAVSPEKPCNVHRSRSESHLWKRCVCVSNTNNAVRRVVSVMHRPRMLSGALTLPGALLRSQQMMHG